MFAYEPLDGYRDEQDAVGFPWERWQQEAGAQGRGIVDLFTDAPEERPPGGSEAASGGQAPRG